MSWHLFCRVVDNYGDAGVAWRLARQLAAAGDDVTLFIDDVGVLSRVEPRVAMVADGARIDGVAVRRYDDHEHARAADVVVSIFGSEPSATYRASMASRPAVVWIDLEYLSAEAWVAGFHGRPSPEPRASLVKHFFYPGFDDDTGGLGIEPDLERRRAAFVADRAAIHRFADALGVDIDDGARRASLFAYPDTPVDALFDAIASGHERWTILVPEGVATAAVARYAARPSDALRVVVHRFLSQDDYDRLLWICDAAFVRGEDSFVRAQAAGVPFVWQPYAQAGRTHDVKRLAFESRYDAGLPANARDAQRAWWRAWNEPGLDVAAAWHAWREVDDALVAHARAWRAALASRTPLVVRLRAWVASRGTGLLD